MFRSFICGYGRAEAVVRRCSVKKGVLKISQYLQENTCVGEETLTQVFSCQYCEIFENTYFEELLRATAFDSSFCSALPEISNNILLRGI